LQGLFDKGVRSLAITFINSYTFPNHELQVADIAKEIGFTQISVSSQIFPMIRAISRGYSATADAYLTPLTRDYIDGFRRGFVGNLEDANGARCEFMQSDGGLVGWQHFSGLKAILSGPAGGVVGFSKTCYDSDRKKPVIGFDMGGTSTDVSRYAGTLEHTFESITAGVTIQSPQLEIDTVAAGMYTRHSNTLLMLTWQVAEVFSPTAMVSSSQVPSPLARILDPQRTAKADHSQ
jgi:5-oxoprolinase (ATP-hydrolysing)